MSPFWEYKNAVWREVKWDWTGSTKSTVWQHAHYKTCHPCLIARKSYKKWNKLYQIISTFQGFVLRWFYFLRDKIVSLFCKPLSLYSCLKVKIIHKITQENLGTWKAFFTMDFWFCSLLPSKWFSSYCTCVITGNWYLKWNVCLYNLANRFFHFYEIPFCQFIVFKKMTGASSHWYWLSESKV